MTLAVAAGCYLLFVVYGSLVPLDFNPRPLETAWREFLDTKYLTLGVQSRADWVANILLYIPLAYLLSAAFGARTRSAAARVLLAGAVWLACAALALGIEFTQLFFPPRTVSLNDIVAEFMGSALGVAIWLGWGDALQRLWVEMMRGGLPAIRAAVVLYVLAYLALSFFPYDFLVSLKEFSDKLASGNYGLLMAPQTCEQLSICASKLIAEIVVVVPLGVLLGMALGRAARHAYAIAALCGVVLGLTIEAVQLVIASGISQGVSVATRAVGMAIGVAWYRHMRWQWLYGLRPYAILAVLLAIPAYLFAVMWANGWFSARWGGLEHAHASLQEVNWLPFYYHYYTTETEALRSALTNVAIYMPIGVLYWMWTLRRSHTYSDGLTLVPALIAAPLAVAMEVGKLFVPGKHPDPTDVLIATVTAPAAYVLARQLQRWAVEGESGAGRIAAHRGSSGAAQAVPVASQSAGRVAAALLLLAGTGIAAFYYPLGGGWLGLALGLYAAVLWRHPGASLPAVLALLPLLNFAPWSGWILLNEFDLLVAVTLAVRLLRPPPPVRGPVLTGSAKYAIGLLAVSFLASASVGLLPLPSFDQNALVSYYTGFNSLRQLKGFAWALALLPLLIEETQNRRMDQRLAAGTLAGLCAVVAVVVWERVVFASLKDFAGEYRVDGPFPELHTGGGDVHAYLVMAIPLVVAWIALRPNAIRIAFGTALFALASYALAMTFTRGGYVGYCGALGVLAVSAVIYWVRQRAWRLGPVVVAGALGLAGLAVMVPIVSGSFMGSRLAAAHSDAATRTRHWAEAINMMDRGTATALFGMGLGSFPKTVVFKERDAASATFSYRQEGGNSYVRLGSGKALYLDQRVAVEAGKAYTISLDLRSPNRGAKVDIPICEKSFQYSFRCGSVSFAVKTPGTGWEHNEAAFNSKEVGSGARFLQRPVALGLTNAQPGTLVDVDNVRLLDEKGRNLIANGDFSRGGERWFFAADDHLPWHIFNLWVQVLFEQGWVGVVALAVAVLMSLARLASGAWRGELVSGALLAALCGFLLVGLTESLFDGPRVTTLFFLLLFAGLLRSAGQSAIDRSQRDSASGGLTSVHSIS